MLNESIDAVLNPRFRSLAEVYSAYGDGNFRIDLGCGFVKPRGFIGLDNRSGEGAQIPDEENAPDILIDLDKERFPFPDDSCLEVRSSHFLEHSGNIDHILSESYRILKPNGTFLIVVPYANSAEGMYPGHSVFFTEKWFYNNLHFQNRFEINKETYYPTDDYNDLPFLVRQILPFSFARKFLFNACWQMALECSAIK